LRNPLKKEDPRARRTSESPGDLLDAELARQVVKGDREALAHLLERHIGPVYGYVERRLGPGRSELTREVVEATFEEALRGIKRYARGPMSRPMRLWLVNIASRQLARRHRAISAKREPYTESGRLLRFRRVLDALAPRKQAALFLALVEELPPQELAGALGTGLPGAMHLLRSALKDAGKSLSAAREEPNG